ncbi:MAG: hypothetical protein ACFFC7_32215 [Candidatus Hermodarchaeota archaeon]
MAKYGKDKLTKEQRAEILSLKGKISAYKVAKDFGVSHTMVYKIWDPQKYKPKKVSSLETEILKCMIPVFIEHELKVDLDPDMTARVETLIQEVLSQ